MKKSNVIQIRPTPSQGNGKRKIDARQALNDVLSGMNDQTLMQKYALSATGLKSLLDKLVEAGLIKESEVEDRASLSQRTVQIAIGDYPSGGTFQASRLDSRKETPAIPTEQVIQYARDLARIHAEEKARRAQLELANQRLAAEIAERKRTEMALRESEERYKALSENSLTGIFIHQNDELAYVNDRLAAMGGFSPAEMLGRPFWEFVHPQDRDIVKHKSLPGSPNKSVPSHYDFRFVCKNGEMKWVNALVGTIQHRGRSACMGNLIDITQNKRAEEEREKLIADLTMAREALNFRASHDLLTGLWNRTALLERLKGELDRADREGQYLAVAMADLDHFKGINDTYGHQAGDAVLQEVANRIRCSLRSYDTAGRYGGEEILIILPGCDGDSAANLAERVRQSICDRSVETDSGSVPVTVSLGVAATGRGARINLDAMISAADSALYRAKRSGRNCVMVAGPEGRPRESSTVGEGGECRYHLDDTSEISVG